MPSLRPGPADRSEPQLGTPAAPEGREHLPGRTALPRPANEGHAAVAPMRLAAEVRRVERQPAAFTAGERLTVASEITGGNETSRPSASRPRFSMVRFVMLTVLLVLAGIGAMTVYRAVTDFVLG